MRLAIVSDIHSNLEAVEQVLDRIEAEKVDRIVCLGDVVGYGPFPGACIRRLHTAAEIIILGNHDDAVIGRTDVREFNVHARTAMRWTNQVLSEEDRAELASYRIDADLGDVHLVHGNPASPLTWDYILSPVDARLNFPAFAGRICFIGHTHSAAVFEMDEDQAVHNRSVTRELILSSHKRYIINVGSVGQPRDGNPDAAFVFYDDERAAVEFVRVEYDVRKTQTAMEEAGLPHFLIKRLQLGH
jgi:predicted phosphodiesterase